MFTITPGREIDIQPGRPALVTGPGLTKSYMKDETDINLIMEKYQKTGLVSFINKQQGEYMDTEAIDFQQAMETVLRANEMFAELPSSMRKRFNNNPQDFYQFVHDENNLEEMYTLGLAERTQAEPEPTPDPTPAEPVTTE